MFQTDLLRGKRVLVTGGGTGLGLAMGRRFLELGASLVICGRREQVLKDAAADLEQAGRAGTRSWRTSPASCCPMAPATSTARWSPSTAANGSRAPASSTS